MVENILGRNSFILPKPNRSKARRRNLVFLPTGKPIGVLILNYKKKLNATGRKNTLEKSYIYVNLGQLARIGKHGKYLIATLYCKSIIITHG